MIFKDLVEWTTPESNSRDSDVNKINKNINITQFLMNLFNL